MQSNHFRLDKNKLGVAISAILVATSSAVFAQESSSVDFEEEVVVTGIRAALENAADIKREATGVVDAISAEDIGKFADANLAESLQRITGVSIDRQNSEGNQITVRGLGPNFNMVTLNGRQMPVASSPEQENIGSATQSRAFNFAEIASESVTGVEVYKTARADVPTGGIGATVNIKTARPFDYDDTKFVFNTKAIHDASVEEGDSLTPEVGALFSKTFFDGTFGILANVSYSERHFSESSTHTDGWIRDEVGGAAYRSWCDTQRVDGEGNVTVANTNNQCGDAPYVYAPVTTLSEIQHFERRRTNGQLVAQLAPTDDIIITVDYVASRFERDQDRFQTALFGTPDANTFDTRLTDNYTLSSTRRVFAADANVYQNELVVENDSVGINVDWQATDSLTLSFDAHSSQAESQPDGELNDNLFLIQGVLGPELSLGYNGDGVSVDINEDSDFRRGTCTQGRSDPNSTDLVNGVEVPATDSNGNPCGLRPNITEFHDVDGFSPLGTATRNIAIKNDVDQAQFDAKLELDESTIDFGLSYVDYQVETNAVSTGFTFQNLGDCPTCSTGLEQISTGAPGGFNIAVRNRNGDVTSFVDENFPISRETILAGSPPTFFSSSEESVAAYLVMSTDTEIAGLPARLTAGLRYEDTDVAGTALQTFPVALQITSNTEGAALFPGNVALAGTPFENPVEPVFFTLEGGYEVFLPSFDFQLDTAEDMVARFSYGKSIARPDLNALRPTTSISIFRPGTATASTGNPNLQPYASDNIDLSYEWYYTDGSYATVAYFYKQIDDYIVSEVENSTVDDVNGNPLLDPRGRFVRAEEGDVAAQAVISEPGDPEAIFETTRLRNSEQRTISGLELAVQHLFGDTGFGMQANYTYVTSDAEYDPNNFTEQGILLGLSDSANLVGFYENEAFSVRLAGNWRDEFLLSENQLRRPNEPVFVKEYLQFDLSSSYSLNENLALNFEILNILGENQQQRGRFEDQFLFENEQEPRISFGISGNF